jgi:predicted transcriptional regulator
MLFFVNIRSKKKMCVYCRMSKKSRVGQSGLIFFFIIDKTGNSHSRFRNPIFHFRNFRLNDELCSFSTFFALNFDKKLAVE